MQKRSIPYTVLAQLGKLGEITLNGFFSSKSGKTAIGRALLGLDSKKEISRKTISTVLWRLKQQGLVERRGAKKIAQWHITPEGKKELNKNVVLISRSHENDGVTRLVIFDIPEKQRRKRNVIRAELVACGFEQLQQSVWIGKCPLPEGFIALIDGFGLSAHVHIFSVRDHGTIEA